MDDGRIEGALREENDNVLAGRSFHGLPVHGVETSPRLGVNHNAVFLKGLDCAVSASAVDRKDFIKTGEIELRQVELASLFLIPHNEAESGPGRWHVRLNLQKS